MVKGARPIWLERDAVQGIPGFGTCGAGGASTEAGASARASAAAGTAFIATIDARASARGMLIRWPHFLQWPVFPAS
jgi:hypothetical protein